MPKKPFFMLIDKFLQSSDLRATAQIDVALHKRLKGVAEYQDKIKTTLSELMIDQKSATLPLFSRSTIRLFKLEEKASRPDILLEEVLSWTGTHQPFLIQKLCQLLCESQAFIPAGEEAARIEKLVQTRFIDHWETQVASEHLKAIREGLVRNQQCDSLSLLRLYQQILQQGEVLTDNSPEQAKLLNLGLIVQQNNKLKVSNRIYQSVFNQSWVDQELARLGPFSYSTIRFFQLEEKASRPDILLEEVLSWTGTHQPFLIQKLCQLLCESQAFIPAGEEAATVEKLVQTRFIDRWETQVASEHLKAIREGIVRNQQCDSLSLLRLYQQILKQGEVLADDSPAQAELLNLGLIVQQHDKLKISDHIYQSVFHLKVSNRIYQCVFNQSWVDKELEERLKNSPSKTTTSDQNKPVLENASLKATNSIFGAGIINLQNIGFFLKITGFLLVIVAGWFNISRFLEEKILFKRGNELFSKGEYQKAIATYNEVLKIDSNYYQAWTNRGYALAGLQEYNKMLESCSAATIIEPMAVYGWNCQGEALHNLKQYDKAIVAFDKAITLDPTDYIFLINKAESLLALQQPDKGLAVINQAIQLLEEMKEISQKETIQKNLSVALNHKGLALSQKQDYQGAIEAYNQALTYDPNYFAAQQGLGIVLQNWRRYDQAIAQFNQILSESNLTNVQTRETWYYLGLALCRSSHVKKGLIALEEALKLKPDYQAAEKAKNNCIH